MALVAPKLHPIDPEMLLFGKIHILWEDVGAPIYFLFRDYEPIKNISGWAPYQVIDEGKTSFDDSVFENHHVYYYAVCAVNEDGTVKDLFQMRHSLEYIVRPKYECEGRCYCESSNR